MHALELPRLPVDRHAGMALGAGEDALGKRGRGDEKLFLEFMLGRFRDCARQEDDRNDDCSCECCFTPHNPYLISGIIFYLRLSVRHLQQKF